MAKQEAVTGVVLAGGASRRLGRDKRLEPFNGEPLLSRVMARLGSVCEELVAVVADASVESGLPVAAGTRIVEDRYPGKGSLGGIYTGLSAASNPWIFVVACDMPFLDTKLIEHMLSLREGHDVVVPVVAGRPEPTHAAYAQACLAPIRDRLERDELKIVGFFDDVRVRRIPEDEVRRYDPDLLTFFNINTQGDLDQALALARAGR